MYCGQKVFFILLGDLVEIVAIREYLDTDTKDLIVEDDTGRLWECTSYEVLEV